MPRETARTLDQVEKELAGESKPAEVRAAPKELDIQRSPDGLYFCRFTSGGELPDMLKSKWTSIRRAQEAVDLYHITKAAQEQKAA